MTPAHGKAAAHAAKSTTVTRPAEINRCTGCHGANLQGRKGFSPGITRTTSLHDYNKKSFEKLMDTAIDNHGKSVNPPMPAFHYPAKVSDALFKYLMAQK